MTTEDAFWQHTLNSMTQDACCSVLLHAKFCGGVETLATGIACIVCVQFLGFLFASEYHFVGINDYNIVSTVHMGCEGWFVLSAEKFSHFAAQTSNHLAGGVDNNPFLLGSLLVDGNGKVFIFFWFTTKKQFFLLLGFDSLTTMPGQKHSY